MFIIAFIDFCDIFCSCLCALHTPAKYSVSTYSISCLAYSLRSEMQWEFKNTLVLGGPAKKFYSSEGVNKMTKHEGSFASQFSWATWRPQKLQRISLYYGSTEQIRLVLSPAFRRDGAFLHWERQIGSIWILKLHVVAFWREVCSRSTKLSILYCLRRVPKVHLKNNLFFFSMKHDLHTGIEVGKK